jgi:hypothetical protein
MPAELWSPWSVISATTGYCGDGMYLFSTSAFPLEGDCTYDRFQAYALLNYGGDYSAAAKALAAKGYCFDLRAAEQRPLSTYYSGGLFDEC